MDSFPDIRSFSDDELAEFLASLSRNAASSATDLAMPGGDEKSQPEDPVVVYRRNVLNNKIELVREEIASRRGRADPD